MVRIITFGSKKIWLFIEQLHTYENGFEDTLIANEEFVCYFNFTEPTLVIYGELIREATGKYPMIFESIETAEAFASDYLEKRFHLHQ